MALTQETVLTFLLEHGGKVKNSELLNHFKSQINCSDPAEKQHNRDLFKKIVNSVAVVKQIDDAKFVVVKKRYQDFVKGGFVRVDAQKADLLEDDSVRSRNTSFSPSCSERSASLGGKMLHSDIENNNAHYSSNINDNYFSDNTKHIPVHSDVDGYYYPSGQRGVPLLSSNSNSGHTTVKGLNITRDPSVKAGKTGAVFAVIAVKSPPHSPRESVLVRQDGFGSKVLQQQKAPEKPNPSVNTVPSPSEPTVDSYCPGSDQDVRTSHWSRPPMEQGEQRQAPSSPRDERTSHWSRPPMEQGEERQAPSSPRDERTSHWSRPPMEQGEQRQAPSSPRDERTSHWSRPPMEQGQGEQRQAPSSPRDERTSHWSRPPMEQGEERQAPSSPRDERTSHWSRPPMEQGEQRQAPSSPRDERTSHWSRPPMEQGQGEQRQAPSSPRDERTSHWSRPPMEQGQGEQRQAPSSPRDERTSHWSRPPMEQGEERQAPSSPRDTRTSHWSRPPMEQGEERQAPSSPQLRKTQHKSTRQGDDHAKYPESFPLEPAAHEWLVKSASGLWGQIYGLLLRDTHLAKKKDFMSGFTAVHWAAKGGNSDMVRKIMNVSSKKRGSVTRVDVDSKAHGGYTPLHIAAIHGQEEVMFLLVQGYGAKVDVRDNHGKKPCHYLDKGASDKVRELLGGPLPSVQDRTEDDCREIVPKGLNTISRLFQPHIGHRKKHRQQPGVCPLPARIRGMMTEEAVE